MRVFRSKSKNILYTMWRLTNPVFDPLMACRGLKGYFWFARDLIKLKKLCKDCKVSFWNLYPRLHDKTPNTPIDAHYLYQQLWVFENILKNRPIKHVDVGSTYEMSGYISKITSAEFVDIRPIEAYLENLKVINASITSLPYKDNEIMSLSCLHVIEHIGLGRYGDDIDPQGPIKAANELQRVLAKNGKLYLSTPVGKNKICFNAHRVFDPEEVINMFKQLNLLSFHIVDDSGSFIQNADIRLAKNQNYACGMFEFTK